VILSVAVLLLQLAVVQQRSTANIDSITASEPAGAESAAPAVAGDAGAGDADLLANLGPISAILTPPPSEPDFTVPLEPGRLTPTPLVAAEEPPVLELPALAPFVSTPFTPQPIIASKPTGIRAQLDQMLHNHVWLGLAIAQSSTAMFDAWTTRRVISSGEGHELDPLMRPFSGNASLYAAIQVSPLAFDYLGWRMMHSPHEWERRLWWLPQGLSAGMSLGSAAHNLGVR